jgi:hypothetical protein
LVPARNVSSRNGHRAADEQVPSASGNCVERWFFHSWPLATGGSATSSPATDACFAVNVRAKDSWIATNSFKSARQEKATDGKLNEMVSDEIFRASPAIFMIMACGVRSLPSMTLQLLQPSLPTAAISAWSSPRLRKRIEAMPDRKEIDIRHALPAFLNAEARFKAYRLQVKRIPVPRAYQRHQPVRPTRCHDLTPLRTFPHQGLAASVKLPAIG